MSKRIACKLCIYPVKVVSGESINAVAASPKRHFFSPRNYHFDTNGGRILHTNAQDSCIVDTKGVAPGIYKLKVNVYQGFDERDQVENEVSFEVVEHG